MERKRNRTSWLLSYFNSEKLFYQIGLSIGKSPWIWLAVSVSVAGAFSMGMLLWKEELDNVKLLMPKDSIIRRDAAWVKENFQDDLRYESILITAPNILDPQVLQVINDIEEEIKNIVVNNATWQDVCAGYLTWFNDGTNTNKSKPNKLDPVWQAVMDEMNGTFLLHGCIYQSILKIWEPAEIRSDNFTRDKVLDDLGAAIKNVKQSILTDVIPLLSGLVLDKSGRPVRARATLMNWMLKKSHSSSADWELEFINRVMDKNRTLPNGMAIYVIATRSYDDFLGQVLESNMMVLLCGLSLLVVYVMTMISKCNLVQQRIYLSLMGISVVGQAIGASYGLCFYMGYFYGPIHPILPFLLLGIGVDDTFVVMQSLENLSESDRALPISKRIGLALQQSGSSITVTSTTNMMAFAIGISTDMPFLKSFCVFATTGILFLYIFEITFFVSCLTIDERRVEQAKDGFCCQPQAHWRPNDCSQRSFQRKILSSYVGPFLTNTSVKIVVIIFTCILVSINIWGILQLRQDFDPLWYLDQTSYPVKFNEKLKQYFPQYGKRAVIYFKGVDYYDEREPLMRLVCMLQQNFYVNNATFDPWFAAYEQWLQMQNYEPEDKAEYYAYLTEFLLLTKEGQSYVKDIKFDSLPVGNYTITASQIQIQHNIINTTTNQIKAMESVRDLVTFIQFQNDSSDVVLFSLDYIAWTANKLTGEELMRNLCLEILAVAIITVTLIRNLRTSFWVICCVIFTLIDLLGSMHFVGLTIEISTGIMILLCAGLAVDYAAHVGLQFIKSKGKKNERLISTLDIIGPAVLNGGFSTFLAFVMLGGSNSYLSTTFFKLFTAVVVFGLWHGLIFLPVILSIYGPNEKKKRKPGKSTVPVDQNGYRIAEICMTSDNALNRSSIDGPCPATHLTCVRYSCPEN